MIYLNNAFSLSMLDEAFDNDADQTFLDVRIEPVPQEIAKNLIENAIATKEFKNTIGFENTDNVVRKELNILEEHKGVRQNVSMASGDIVIVAQYHGDRLAEGATELPVGSRLSYNLIKILN